MISFFESADFSACAKDMRDQKWVTCENGTLAINQNVNNWRFTQLRQKADDAGST